MRILVATALLALLTAPASAQAINWLADQPKDPVAEQKREESERAYKAATRKIPEQKATANDPWGNVRGTNEAPSTRPRTR